MLVKVKVTAMPVKVSESDASESGNYASESESDSYASESESEASDIYPKFEGSRNLLINLKHQQ